MRLEPRAQTPAWLWLAAPLAALAFTLAVTSLLVAWAGAPVGRAYARASRGLKR
jgi:simple sugar transport system permease protein